MRDVGAWSGGRAERRVQREAEMGYEIAEGNDAEGAVEVDKGPS